MSEGMRAYEEQAAEPDIEEDMLAIERAMRD